MDFNKIDGMADVIPNTVEGTDNRTFPKVRLDGPYNNMVLLWSGGKLGSAAYVLEQDMDDYTKEFIIAAKPFIDFIGVEDGYNKILTHRNGSKDRNRLESAKYASSFVPKYKIISENLNKSGYIMDVDVYYVTHLWVGRKIVAINGTQDVDWIGAAIEIADDKLHFGWGDGYHRSFDNSVKYDITSKGIAKLVKVIESNPKE